MKTEQQEIFSPAKINLSLSIGDFIPALQKHKINSVMQKISLSDHIQIRTTENKKIKISISGKYAKGVPNNTENIVYKAAKLFFSKYGFSFGIDIHIEKNIPHSAGLGGGSSNAATILLFLYKHTNRRISPKEYAEIGSDIPFFLHEYSTAIVESAGEKVQKYNKNEKYKYGILLFPKNVSVSSAWAFSERKNGNFSWKKSVPNISQNDFTPLLCSRFPETEKILQKISKISPEKFGISGSGGSIFALTNSKKEQQEIGEAMKDFSGEVETFICM